MNRNAAAWLVLLLTACGGGGEERPAAKPGTPLPGAGSTTPTRIPASPPAAGSARAGQVHEVRMELAGAGRYRFTPAALTIRAGDVVRWVNGHRGAHNVAFKRDRIPAGAADVLNAAMDGRINDLQGPFVLDSLADYEVSFENAPPGTYAYTCAPHEMLGMNGTITVMP